MRSPEALKKRNEIKEALKRRKTHFENRKAKARAYLFGRLRVLPDTIISQMLKTEIDKCTLLLTMFISSRPEDLQDVFDDAEWFLRIDYCVAAQFKTEILQGLADGDDLYCIETQVVKNYYDTYIVPLFDRKTKIKIEDFKRRIDGFREVVREEPDLGRTKILVEIDRLIKVPDHLPQLYKKFKPDCL